MTKNNLSRKPKRPKVPFIVFGVSLILSLAVTYLFYLSSVKEDDARFQNAVTRIVTAINNKIRTYIAMLKSGRGFVETVPDVSRQSFRTFIVSLVLRRNYPGILGIGYAKRVLSYEAQALAQKMEGDGFTNYRIFPQTAKYDYIAIQYIEPLDERNRRALGFDMSSETNRRMSMEKAAITNEVVATGKFFLV